MIKFHFSLNSFFLSYISLKNLEDFEDLKLKMNNFKDFVQESIGFEVKTT